MILAKTKTVLDYLQKVMRRLWRYPLAWLVRRRFRSVVVVGITGSAGKTTTKNLVFALLNDQASTIGSDRSEIEQFLTAQVVASLNSYHRYCVLELSEHKPGSLDLILNIAKPAVAVLTGVKRDHFSAFTSMEAIADEMAKLVKRVPSHGVAVLNYDDPYVRKIGEHAACRILSVGIENGSDVRLISAVSAWPEPLEVKLLVRGRTFHVRTKLHGVHLAHNVAISLGVALALKVPLQKAIESIKAVEPEAGRMQPFVTNEGISFLRDDWKAPHWSLSSAFDFMRKARAERKIIVLGTVSDYSLSASKLYPKIARQALEVADLVVFAGPHAARACKAEPDSTRLRGFEHLAEASEFLKQTLRPGDLVLLKGSNKADHLVRLIIDRESPVTCWVYGCGKDQFCRPCGALHAAHPEPIAGASGEVGLPKISLEALAGRQYHRAIIGLGNPGAKYENTPHNLGFRVLDVLAASGPASWQDGGACYATALHLGEEIVLLIKPNTPINHSGSVVKAVAEELGIAMSAITLVHDDMDLDLGRVKAKTGGGDAGHKGVRSVVTAMKSSHFKRLRVGARRPGDSDKARGLVLRPFSNAELITVKQAITECARSLKLTSIS